jgi:hypothetical protein
MRGPRHSVVAAPALGDAAPGTAHDARVGSRRAARRLRWPRDPLAQFLIIGVALFLVDGALNRGGSQSGSAYRIALTTDDIQQLRDTFAAQWQRPPSPEEMRNLQESRVEDIRATGLVAERAVGTALPALNDLVIQGQFLRIDEGSKVKRFIIGFRSGATELRTQVEIFHVSANGWQPVTQFDTVAEGARFPGAGVAVAGSAAIAGAAATGAVMGTGVGVVREMRASIEADAQRTSLQIAAKVSDLKSLQRW